MSPARGGAGETSSVRGAGRTPSSPPHLSSPAVPYPGFEGIIPGHVIQQGGQRVDFQINTAHLLPGLEGQGSEHPSQVSIPTPPQSGQRHRGDLLCSLWGCPSVAALPKPPYLWGGRYGGLRPSLLIQWRRWGREDLLLQGRRGKWLLDRGRRRWEGTSQGALRVVAIPKERRGWRGEV